METIEITAIRIPVNKLALSPLNVRKKQGSGIEELAALIASQGLIHNLVVTEPVKKSKKIGKYEVVAGGRRLAALNLLVSDGHLPKDHSVECRVAMHVTGFGTFANALPLGHLLRVFQPLVLVAQSSQRRSCQRIECGLADSAAVALQSRGRTPARDVVMTTLGARRCRQCATSTKVLTTWTCPIFRRRSFRSPLWWCQFLKLFRQCLEFFGSHCFTYLTDSYG